MRRVAHTHIMLLPSPPPLSPPHSPKTSTQTLYQPPSHPKTTFKVFPSPPHSCWLLQAKEFAILSNLVPCTVLFVGLLRVNGMCGHVQFVLKFLSVWGIVVQCFRLQIKPSHTPIHVYIAIETLLTIMERVLKDTCTQCTHVHSVHVCIIIIINFCWDFNERCV